MTHSFLPEKMLKVHGERTLTLYTSCLNELKEELDALHHLLANPADSMEPKIKLHNMMGIARILYDEELIVRIIQLQVNFKVGGPTLDSDEYKWIARELDDRLMTLAEA